MPYQINKGRNRYRLFNLHKKEYVKVWYHSKQSAINAGKNFMRYRKEIPKVEGNRIINIKKKSIY